MKKLYILISTAIFSANANAQLTQANHAPADGDTYSMWDFGTTANPGAAGNGVVWDFSSISTNSSTVLNYTAATTTNTNYPNANVTVAASASNVSHYDAGSAGLMYYGGNISVGTAVAGTMTYTDAAVEAVYPMSLNTSSTAPISGTVQVTVPLSAAGSFTGNSHTIADGSGTLILPGGGTYSNVLRVVTSQTIDITAGSAPFTTTASVTMSSFNFYTPGIKAPVVSIFTATAAMMGGAPSSQTLAMRNTTALGTTTTNTTTTTGVQNEPVAAQTQLFPNPANEQVTVISASASPLILELTDISGKKVFTQKFTGSAVINTSNFTAGIYLYTVKNTGGEKQSAGRLTVVH